MGHIVSRRVFLTACGGAAVAATVPAALNTVQPSAAANGVGELTLDMFQPLVGDSFTITPEGGAAPLRVVLKLAARSREAFTRDQDGRVVMDGFSLEFAGVPAAETAAGVHTLHHPAIGSHGLLMTPIGSRDEGHKRLEVVFNRMLTA